MIVVQLSGGLGNQMFEYALYLKLRAQGKDVKIDDVTCYGQGQRTKQLSVFGLSYERVSQETLERMTDSCMRIDCRIRRKLFGRKSLCYREADVNFDPEVLCREPAVLQGCFQSERYFSDIADQVREAFTFRALERDAWLSCYEQKIRGCRAVSVHIRRGDYLDPRYSALYRDICTDAYYEGAIRRMQQRFPDAVFFFFSNDQAWVKERYRGERFITVEGAGEDCGYRDLYLISLCKHNIIANSSFSWWGAWLNANPDKRVIAPSRWLNGRDCRDIYCDFMSRLDAAGNAADETPRG